LSVKEALQVINQVLDEVQGEQDAEFDKDTQAAVAWFAQYGLGSGPSGELEGIVRPKDTSIEGMKRAGILHAGAGKARLLGSDDLDSDWDPDRDERLTIWECLHQTMKRLEAHGEEAAGHLLARLRGKQAAARALAHRLYSLADRRGDQKLAGRYNDAVASWEQIQEHAQRASAGWRGPLDQFSETES
jgi:putative DNA methylase